MRIGILSRNKNLYSTARLIEAAESRGHIVDVLDPLKCYMNISTDDLSVHYEGKILPTYDAIIPRIGSSITFYGMAVVRQFEMMGVYCLNESQGIGRSRDKLRSLQLLSRQGIGLPITSFAHNPDDTGDIIAMVGGVPLVVKLLQGTQGVGVVLAETKKAAESVIDAFRGLKTFFLVQEFIKEAAGTDIRCFVIGSKVVAAMMRKGRPGEFRSNLHRGGEAFSIEITEEERNAAIKATKALGLRVSGVDILRSHKGPLVMEVNSSPGLEGIENSSHGDIAGEIIKFLERNARKKDKVDPSAG